jgi:hypothetical protein
MDDFIYQDDFILHDDGPFERDTIIDDAVIQDDDQYAFRSLTNSQKTLLAILPIPSAILSVLGSSVVIYMALLSRKSRPWTPYNRLLVAMSVYDIITSIALASSTFLNPMETSNKAWAMGNDSTCSAMGFFNNIGFSGTLVNNFLNLLFNHFVIYSWLLYLLIYGIYIYIYIYTYIIYIHTGTLYNACLSYYFLFTARFRMKNEQISRRIEPAMHVFSVGFPLITGVIGLVLGVYAEPVAGMGCWVYR